MTLTCRQWRSVGSNQSSSAMRRIVTQAGDRVAGHADLATTQRYMHLSPAATEDAIRLLDGSRVVVAIAQCGEI